MLTLKINWRVYYPIVKLNTRIMRTVYLFLLAASLLFVGCKKDVKSPAEMLEGKWIITSQEVLATVVAGDGSYLTFNACSSSCNGTDYKASDMTSGTFEYVLNNDATQIVIVDNSPDGGSYNATWDILELTEDSFRITGSTILGNLKIKMTKG